MNSFTANELGPSYILINDETSFKLEIKKSLFTIYLLNECLT